jgi:hypothetical protein
MASTPHRLRHGKYRRQFRVSRLRWSFKYISSSYTGGQQRCFIGEINCCIYRRQHCYLYLLSSGPRDAILQDHALGLCRQCRGRVLCQLPYQQRLNEWGPLAIATIMKLHQFLSLLTIPVWYFELTRIGAKWLSILWKI